MGRDYKILIVDDEAEVISALKRLLRRPNYIIESTVDPYEAVKLLEMEQYDILITDLRMPNLSGIELLVHSTEIAPETLRILMTGYPDVNIIADAVNNGRIFKYINKPWDNDIFVNLVEEAIEEIEQREIHSLQADDVLTGEDVWKKLALELKKEIMEKKKQEVELLMRIIQVKDEALLNHSMRVARHALKLAKFFGLSDQQKTVIQHGALFHDIGKIAIKDKILYKEGILNYDEYNEIKYHPLVGARILRELDFLEDAATIVYQHHEKIDGSGYPEGLNGKEITLETKLVSISDFYDALQEDRVYRKSVSKDEIIKILREKMGQHFDKEIVEAFIDILQNGEKE